METIPAKICRRLTALEGARQAHESAWRDCYDFTYPLRAGGFNAIEVNAQNAADRRARLLDGTGTDSARVLASGLMSGLTPPTSRWVAFDIADMTDAEHQWFDASADAIWRNIHAANFDAAGFEAALDVVCAGWFVLYVEEKPGGGYQFDTWPLSQCYVAASKAGGRIDTVYRKYELSAEQAVADFGDEVSEATRKLAADKPDDRVCFVHAIFPRTNAREGSALAKNLPIASFHVEVKAKKAVRESGYHEMPVIVPRWMVVPGSAYSVGPAFDALPEMKMLNQLKAMELAAADLAVAGMWIAEDDGVLNPRTIKVGPRKVIVANSVDSMKPLQSGSDFNVAFTAEERLVAAIRKTFMADQLQPQDGPAMTATEVHVRVNLIRQLLGPVYGRLQAEYLQPLIERCFGIAMRAGVLRDPPGTLEGREFAIKYISPLARAQSLEEVSAMDQYETVLMNESQVRPEVLDNYDFDESARHRAKLLGVPAKLLRKSDDVAQLRESRQQAQDQAQQTQLAQGALAQAAPKIIERAVA